MQSISANVDVLSWIHLCPVSPVVVTDLISSLPHPEDTPEGHQHRENRPLHLPLQLLD